jgi:hypothetical protein
MLAIVLGGLSGCKAENQEGTFFSGDVASRNERLEGLPVEKQWEIFKYGNQVRHPPATSLAPPIAKGGKKSLYFILNTLHSSGSDLDYRDSMVIFQTMQWGGYYDVCSDPWAMMEIRGNEGLISNSDWKKVYGDMLIRLCKQN